MTTNGEKRDDDLAALFEKNFKEASREVSTGMSADAKRRYDGENRVIYFTRFYPVGAMVAVMALAGFSAFLLGYAGKHILDGWFRSFLAAWLTLACQIAIVYIMWISGRATRHQTASGRWQRIVERMISAYETSGRDPKDILRGVRISVHFYQETLVS